ncbi:MAG: ABC transporter ATP-binding protein [Gemmataceae bacterium]|nr:ABC transporter ATP-binding protein [Gemmataceae bacterium]
MIELLDVTKRYGTKLAVDRLSLTIPAGELFAFLGPNGAGKTTTIKMLCGLLFPTSGTVRVGGFDLATHGDDARRLIAFVPDTPYLYEKLTGREFLRFIGDLYGLDPARRLQKEDEVIELFRLGEFVDDLTERYSHGMRQRTVFAAALLHEPKVLIVDEPTVGLDPKSIRLLKDLLRKQARGGTTVFLSTHSLDIAQELADRIGIIDRGKVVCCGTLDSLRQQADLAGTLEEVFLKLTTEEGEE